MLHFGSAMKHYLKNISSSQETETGRSCDIWIWTWILTLQSSGYPDLPRIMIKVASKIATEVALILVIRKLKNL